MKKISNYVISKLNLKTNENGETEENNDSDNNIISIICNNNVLLPNLTLASVKQFYWKTTDEFTLHYIPTNSLKTFKFPPPLPINNINKD